MTYPYVIPIDDFNNLRGIYVNYRNEAGFSGAFHLRMPIEINYAWGTMKAYMVINVKDTGSTTPQ